MEKKVLIITYYWPPSGGSGVQRWLKFVKYLPQFGWQPFVYTPENPSFDVKDESLLKDVPAEAEVIKLPIWEPYHLADRLLLLFGKKERSDRENEQAVSAHRSWLQRFISWVRANLFIPDPRIFWMRPSVAFLHDFLKDRQINTIITTGPPHSMHLIGLKLKQKNPNLRWLADFRDPWTEWGLWEKLGVGEWGMKRHRKLEQQVLTNADRVISVTPFYVERLEALSGRKADLLTNGFDDEDVEHIRYLRTAYFIIRHIGIVNEQRDPVPFMEAFTMALTKDKSFREQVRLEFVGEVYAPFKAYVEARPELQPYVTFTGNVSHDAVMDYYGSSSLLLLILTGYRDPHGFFPGKLFEYVATGIPILGIGPDPSDAADVLQKAGTGVMIAPEEKEQLVAQLLTFFAAWKNNPHVAAKPLSISAYSRKVITGDLARILEE